MDGVATITATATEDLASLALDAVGLDIADGDRRRRRRHRRSRGERDLIVTPAEPVRAGDEFTVVVTYGASPQTLAGVDFLSPGWVADGDEVYVAFEPHGAATLFPANDHPSDKATYTFRVTVPRASTWRPTGCSAGPRPATASPPGSTTRPTRWRPTSSRSSSPTSSSSSRRGPERPADPPRLRRRHRRRLAEGRWTATAEMIDLYDDLFGPYPFVAYGAVVVDEPARVRARDPDAVDLRHRRRRQRVGHRPRAGPPVVRRRRQPRHVAGHLAQRGVRHLRRAGCGRSTRAPAGPISSPTPYRAGSSLLDLPPADPGAEELFAASVYDRGALTLHVLDETVGARRSSRSCGRGSSATTTASASTADFEALAEEVSGAGAHRHVRRVAAGA